MNYITSFCVAITMSVFSLSMLAADGAKDDGVKVQASLETWTKLKDKCGGNYRYFVRTASFSGMRTETEVVVQENKVTGRQYKVTGVAVLELSPLGAPKKPAEPKFKWTERGDDIGSNKGGAPAKTLDELYADALKVAAQDLKPSEQRYVRFDAQGLLKSCFYVDTRIADDAPTTGVSIAEIRLQEADK